MTRLGSAIAAFLVLVLGTVPAAAQTSAVPDLELSLTGPAETPLVGDLFTLELVVSNSGSAAAADVFLSDYASPELVLHGAVPSSPDDTCSEQGSGDDSPPPPGTVEPAPAPAPEGAARPGFYGGVDCSLGTMEPGERTTILLELERVGARETYNSAYLSSSTQESNYENNYRDFYIEPDRSNPADLGVTISGPGEPAIGATFDYDVRVTNNGPSTADAVTLVSSMNGTSIVSIPSACRQTFADPSYGGYAEVGCDLGSLASGQTLAVLITVERSSPWEIYNSAYVTGSGFDENYENDYAFHSIPADPSVTSDLGLTLEGPAELPLVGTTFDMVMTVTNSGPSAAGDVWVNDYLPDGLEFVAAEPADRCSYNNFESYPYADGPTAAPAGREGDAYYPIYANGLYCELGSMAADTSETVTLRVTRTKAREVWNSAWVSSSNHDPVYENNYGELQLGPDKTNPTDISVSLSAPEKPEVGSTFDVTMTVANAGPSAATSVVATTQLPYGLEFQALSPSDACTYADGGIEPQPLAPQSDEKVPAYYWGFREVRCDFGSIPAGETRTATVTVSRSSEYEIWTSAWAETADYDVNYENDYASYLIAGEPYPGACPSSGGDVSGTDGADTIVIGDCDIATKRGADTIEAAPTSDGGDMAIEGGRGPDTIRVLLNVESVDHRTIHVDAGPGNDTIELIGATGVGNARVVLEGAGGDDQIVLRLAGGAADLQIVARGQDGRDVMTSVSNGDTDGALVGAVLRGGADRDVIEGGDGIDRLFGGLSVDRLFGGFADDLLDGGRGSDLCRGGPGRDSLRRC
ncbi:MAG TPA: hypothetical protein VJ927_01725 [Actinomycetota bacterium]|nr:hypothetical protein [Actinomycetota bacterium]